MGDETLRAVLVFSDIRKMDGPESIEAQSIDERLESKSLNRCRLLPLPFLFRSLLLLLDLGELGL